MDSDMEAQSADRALGKGEQGRLVVEEVLNGDLEEPQLARRRGAREVMSGSRASTCKDQGQSRIVETACSLLYWREKSKGGRTERCGGRGGQGRDHDISPAGQS